MFAINAVTVCIWCVYAVSIVDAAQVWRGRLRAAKAKTMKRRLKRFKRRCFIAIEHSAGHLYTLALFAARFSANEISHLAWL